MQHTETDFGIGGRDVDELLIAHFTKQFNKKFKCDMSESARAKRRLALACEQVPCAPLWLAGGQSSLALTRICHTD